MRAIALLGLVALSGCNSLSLESDTQKIEAGCASASAALKTLTAAQIAGKLDPAKAERISQAAHIIEPVCTAPEPPTMDSMKRAAFDQAIAELVKQAGTP